MAEALSGNRAQAKASVTRATKPKWQITCSFGLIAAGFAYNYPLKYFPASQPDGTYNLDLPDSDPLKEDYPNVKVTVVAGKVWVSEATLISRKMPNQPIVTIRAQPVVIDNFQIPPLPNSIQFKPAKNPLAQRMRYHD